MDDRRKYLGASEVAAAIGMSKWHTPLDIYERKISDEPQTFERSEEFSPEWWGHKRERDLLEAWSARNGMPVSEHQQEFTGSGNFLRAHVDGIAWSGGQRHAVVEAKTSRSKEGWGDEHSDEIPADYLIQAIVQMHLTGLNQVFIPVLFGGHEYAEYVVNRDETTENMVLDKARAFWECVTTRTPPEPVNAYDVARLFPEPAGIIDAPIEWLEVHDNLVKARAALDDLEKQERFIKERVQLYMRDKDQMRVNGKTLFTWKRVVTSRVDTAQMQVDNPDLVAEYKKPSSYRRFMVR